MTVLSGVAEASVQLSPVSIVRGRKITATVAGFGRVSVLTMVRVRTLSAAKAVAALVFPAAASEPGGGAGSGMALVPQLVALGAGDVDLFADAPVIELNDIDPLTLVTPDGSEQGSDGKDGVGVPGSGSEGGSGGNDGSSDGWPAGAECLTSGNDARCLSGYCSCHYEPKLGLNLPRSSISRRRPWRSHYSESNRSDSAVAPGRKVMFGFVDIPGMNDDGYEKKCACV